MASMVPGGIRAKLPLEERKQNYQKIVSKHPGIIPIICEKLSNSNDILDDTARKFLMRSEMEMSRLLHHLRRSINMSAEKGIYIYVGNSILPPMTATVGEMYEKYADEDGFLYILYAEEGVFGAPITSN